MLYWLKRTGYSGWLTLDIFPYREDGIQSATESIQWIDSILKRIDEVGMHTIAPAGRPRLPPRPAAGVSEVLVSLRPHGIVEHFDVVERGPGLQVVT